MKKNLVRSQNIKGFTFVEILVVLAIVALTSKLAVGSLTKFRASQDVKLASSEIVATLWDVQRRSITQEDGKTWGIRFTNGAGSDAYEIFSGPNYASGTVDKTIALTRNVEFSQPASTSTYDIIFVPVVGGVTSTKMISIFKKTGSATWVMNITINRSGLVTTRLEEGLIAYWPLDEGSGSIIRDATGINPINDQNPPDPLVWHTGSSCKLGSCLQFDGYHTNGLVTTPRTLTKFTVDGWLKLTAVSDHGGVWSALQSGVEHFDARFKGGTRQPQLRLDAVANEEVDASDNLDLNDWYHLAYVYSGSLVKIYINGVEKASSAVGSYTFNLDNWEIGRSEEKDTYLFYGYMDDLRIYDRALSAVEIQKHYNDLK